MEDCLNLKYFIFSVFIISVYHLPVPKSCAHNIIIIFLLGSVSYVLFAWYDNRDRPPKTYLDWMTKPINTPIHHVPMKTPDIIILVLVCLVLLYPFLIQ